ncbi:uncharacterized protein LOC100880510 [Megachile rotundata]|uniref:uncharacterized protein LOC100880510 n=1 Tax=Megachile rotundata TaxID=143995 RepID=UPI003FD57273
MDSVNLSDASQLEKDSKNAKIIHKRRSSIFQNRVISFDECKENEKFEDIQGATSCRQTISRKEHFNLEEYIINLRNERKEWIETLKQRKSQRKCLSKQKLCIENQGQTLDLNVLTEFEKAFITARPNYQQICRNYKKMSDVALKISELQSIVYKLNEKFILQMEDRLHKVTDRIIEMSD